MRQFNPFTELFTMRVNRRTYGIQGSEHVSSMVRCTNFIQEWKSMTSHTNGRRNFCIPLEILATRLIKLPLEDFDMNLFNAAFRLEHLTLSITSTTRSDVSGCIYVPWAMATLLCIFCTFLSLSSDFSKAREHAHLSMQMICFMTVITV